jgi:hypothetical protein
MNAPRGSIARINQMNRKYWLQQSVLMHKRLENPTICLIAFNDVSTDEAETRLVRSRKTYEKALAFAEAADAISRRSFASKGGTTTKTDSLQNLIVEIVKSESEISERNLLKILRKMANKDDAVVVAVDREADLSVGDRSKVHFRDRGVDKTALVSGLKDRLYRAKKLSR